MVNVAIICIAIVVIAVVVILSILIYHLMLALNEHNKRFLLFAQEAIEKERYTMEQLTQATQEIDRLTQELSSNNQTQEQETLFHDEDLD